MTAEFKKCWMLKIYTGEDVIVGKAFAIERSMLSSTPRNSQVSE